MHPQLPRNRKVVSEAYSKHRDPTPRKSGVQNIERRKIGVSGSRSISASREPWDFRPPALSLALNERGHLEFLSHLEISFVCEDFLFVHAGVRPSIPLDQQNEEDLLGIRNDFLHYEGNLGKIVVHGHTPVLHPEVCSNRINIDTGAYATGRLTCLIIERDKMKFISSA